LLLFLIKKKHFSCGHSISSTTFNVKIIWNLVIQCRLDSDLFALNSKKPKHKNILKRGCVWRLIVFAPFLIIIIIIIILLSFFATWTCPRQISGTTFHETWWNYRYMFLVGPKVFSFVVKVVKVILWWVQRVWGLL
jgi:hypothetical protein